MTRGPVSFYDRTTGEFTRFRSIDFGRQPIITRTGEDWTHGRFDGTTCRVDLATGEVVPLYDFAPVVAVNRVSNLPEGTKALYHRHKAIIGPDGVLHINVEYPQTITVHLTRALYNHAALAVECAPESNARGGRDLPQKYDRLRMKEYPDWRELADAIAKDDPAALAEYRAKCLAVKAKFPKPKRN